MSLIDVCMYFIKIILNLIYPKIHCHKYTPDGVQCLLAMYLQEFISMC